MVKHVFLWLLLISLTGCNFPRVLPQVAKSAEITRPTISTLQQPASTPIPNSTVAEPSETQLIPATLLPLATDLEPVPEAPETWAVETRAIRATDGAVLLQDGLCCIGGVVGTIINLRKDFTPPSSFGPVIEMRRKEGMFCYSEMDMADAPWEPFVPWVTEAYRITAINWIGHYISVQYRDHLGNLSPVVCDDISVEGMPAPPTSGP
jgi:hypothetical protein